MGLNLYAKIEEYLDFQDEVERLHREFLKIVIDKNLDNIIDVGCGQGAFVNNLQLNGLNSYGVDLSSAQIEIAKKNGVENVEAIPLNKVTSKFDCATAIFDVINYIDKPTIKTFFKEVNSVLNDNAYFIFDINSLYGFEEIAPGTLSIDLDDKFIVIDANFQDNILITDLTLFTQMQNETFKKESDYIMQYYYENLDLTEILKSCGFKVEKIKGFNLHQDEEFDKYIFICKKLK